MYAIIEASGKQYKVEEGRYVDFELLDKDVDEKITFDKVVMLVNGKNQKSVNHTLQMRKLKEKL